MSYRPFSWPSTRFWVDGGGLLTGTGTIFTCRPWAANRPWSCAMYRPAIDSAGLYIAQDQGLFAAQGLHVKIVPVPVNSPPPSTQNLVDGQEKGLYDITAGDYVTYIEDQLGAGAPKADLRIIAESSFLQPNVLTLLVKGGSPISQVSQLKGQT